MLDDPPPHDPSPSAAPDARPRGDAPAITQLLNAEGDERPRAMHSVMELVYDHLRTIAAAHMSGERRDHTLHATALLHEAFARVFAAGERPRQGPVWNDRAHFFNAMARAMRCVLIDHARAARAGRSPSATGPHGGPRRPLALPESIVDESFQSDVERIEALEEALARLESVDSRAATAIAWRFFNGMTVEQIAAGLGTGSATVKRDILFAKTWLAEEFGPTTKSEGGRR